MSSSLSSSSHSSSPLDTDVSVPVVRTRANVRSLRRRDGLIRFAHDRTSQSGEDGVIAKIFELLGSVERPRRTTRYCVDVGAWDGKHLSNTYSLLVPNNNNNNNNNDDDDVRWRGVLIEADPERCADLRRSHEPLGHACVRCAVSCRPDSPDNLSNLLRREGPSWLPLEDDNNGDVVDLLTVDVDGPDLWVTEGTLSRGVRPSVLCVEFNPTMPDDLVYAQPRRDDVRHGSSLSALVELVGDRHGYALVETTLYNAFFVRRDLYDGCEPLRSLVPDSSIEALHESTTTTHLYQLYDGTLRLHGCRRMLWHRMPINEEKLQTLPPGQRSFPFAPPDTTTTSTDTSEHDRAIRDAAVDLSPYVAAEDDATDGNRRDCASSLLAAFSSDGFAYVRGTGLSSKICRDGLEAARAFLEDADESVRRTALSAKDRARRGYSPSCTENFGSLVGEKTRNDLVRKFRMGPPVQASFSSSLSSPNVWPRWTDDEDDDDHASRSFRDRVETYYEGACRVADAVLRALRDGYRNEHDGEDPFGCLLSNKHDDDTDSSILTLLGYRPGSRHKKGSSAKKKKGSSSSTKDPLVAAHTDVGVLTLLLFDRGECAALQRRDGDDGWTDVTLPADNSDNDDPVFVVNLGDCASDLASHGDLPSTLHRVVPRGGGGGVGATPRCCLALFWGPRPGTELRFSSSGGDLEDVVVSYEEWRRRRVAEALRVLEERKREKG